MSKGSGIDIDLAEHLDDLSDNNLNGRQISNAIRTAWQVASYQREVFTIKHIHQAIRVVQEFDIYVGKVRGGHSDEVWAREEMLR